MEGSGTISRFVKPLSLYSILVLTVYSITICSCGSRTRPRVWRSLSKAGHGDCSWSVLCMWVYIRHLWRVVISPAPPIIIKGTAESERACTSNFCGKETQSYRPFPTHLHGASSGRLNDSVLPTFSIDIIREADTVGANYGAENKG